VADTKISALTSLAATDVVVSTDVLPIVDTSVTTTKKVTVSALGQSMIVLGTEQASTSGTEIDFTGIPAGTKRITIMFVNVSTNGTSVPIIQLGDSGGIEATGYAAVASFRSADVTSSVGFPLGGSLAANDYYGAVILSLEDATDFTWVATGTLYVAGAGCSIAGGKSLSSVLTTVRITTTNGTDAFDTGSINITYT
jgi:hypothetical protein